MQQWRGRGEGDVGWLFWGFVGAGEVREKENKHVNEREREGETTFFKG